MNDSTPSISQKQCIAKDACLNPLGCWLPATPDYFNRDKHKRDGLTGRCKVCAKAESKRYRDEHPNAERERKAKDPERFKIVRRDYRLRNRDKIRQDKRRYWDKHKDTINQRRREKRANSGGLIQALDRERYRLYRPYRQDKMILIAQRRRARVRQLPDTLTMQQWEKALVYFDHKCAICGRAFEGAIKPTADHWIPIASLDCPGTTVLNIVPMCHSVKGCNARKSDKLPMDWLTQEYGHDKAVEIIDRIETYFRWAIS